MREFSKLSTFEPHVKILRESGVRDERQRQRLTGNIPERKTQIVGVGGAVAMVEAYVT